MSTVQEGNKVTLCYVGKLDNGELFKTVEESAPLTVTVGKSEAPPTLDLALRGMKVGEEKSVRVPPDESYGPRQKELLQELPIESFGGKITPKKGMILSLKVNKDGEEHAIPATVIEVDEQNVTVDYNHPLAGHHLTYNIKVLAIEG